MESQKAVDKRSVKTLTAKWHQPVLGNFQHQYLPKQLVNVYSSSVMVKSVSYYCVDGTWLCQSSHKHITIYMTYVYKKILPKILIMSGQIFHFNSSCTSIVLHVGNIGYLLCKTLLNRDTTFSATLVFSTNFSNPVKYPVSSKSCKMIIEQVTHSLN